MRGDELPQVGVEVFSEVGAEVGEGPYWDAAGRTLWQVDLTRGQVLRCDATGTIVTSFDAGQEVGAAIPRRGGGLVLAVRDGIATTSESGDGFEIVVPIERGNRANRMNDAKCDPNGRLFAGTTAFAFTPGAGALYRVGADWSWQPVVTRVTISNGTGWSPDGTHMYFIDSLTQGVDVFDYDVSTGTVANRSRLLTIPVDDGVPDGMAVDAEGGLWVACFNGGAVRHYSPEGDLVGHIPLPVSQVTSCAFGGADLTDLFVTTACYQMTPEQRRSEPHAGATFVCRPGVAGTPGVAFAG